jgi:hypothetical protein
MLYGAGSLILKSRDLNLEDTLRQENLIHPLSIASFELTFEDQNIEAKALIGGKRQIVAAAISESIATLKLTFEYLDWNTIGLAYDELPSMSTNVTLPQIRSKIAVSPTPGDEAEIADTDLPASILNADDYLVYVSSRGPAYDRKYLKVISTADGGTIAAVDPNTVLIDNTAKKLILDPIYNGAIIQYTIPKTYTSIETFGVESEYDSYGDLIFQGIVAGTEFGKSGMGIVIPKLSRISSPGLTVNGDLATMEVEFRASVLPGERRAFKLYNLATAV